MISTKGFSFISLGILLKSGIYKSLILFANWSSKVFSFANCSNCCSILVFFFFYISSTWAVAYFSSRLFLLNCILLFYVTKLVLTLNVGFFFWLEWILLFIGDFEGEILKRRYWCSKDYCSSSYYAPNLTFCLCLLTAAIFGPYSSFNNRT